MSTPSWHREKAREAKQQSSLSLSPPPPPPPSSSSSSPSPSQSPKVVLFLLSPFLLLLPPSSFLLFLQSPHLPKVAAAAAAAEAEASDMGRASPRLPSFCLNRITTARVRVRSPPSAPPEAKPPPSEEPEEEIKNPKEEAADEAVRGRRIMIVAEATPESKTALLWALSHSVQSNDAIVLVSIVKPSKRGEQSRKDRDPKSYELLQSMKSICQAKKPEVQVELSLVEGMERGPAIVEEARRQGPSLLIMGQKKRSLTWRLIMMWAGSKMISGGSIADYCVQNATCMAVAVRRKSRRGGGGYLITTKRHKDFWLLA
ncbi:hypothetical protein Cni_G25767 [Canna indica]|uniref:UspA domain-containing protein n=1 Tax=Canna indica TaxID=4628 RepID=A0AAQ3QMQ8_9LILI|nr:hypothetical protein Cni_G25767 [Canna indica]